MGPAPALLTALPRQVGKPVQQRLHLRQEPLPLGRQAHTLSGTEEQRKAQGLLQLSDGPAQVGLGQVQGPGCLGHGAMANYG